MKLMLRIGWMAATFALAVTGAKGATVYGLTDGATQHLVTFASGTPGTFLTNVAISGLPAGYELIGMDMRTTVQTINPANAGVGTLWALGTDMTNYRLFTVSTSGVATAVGGVLTPMTSAGAGVGTTNWGFAFNPGKDRFEAVGVFYNFEIDPNTGTAVRDADVSTPDSANPAFSGATFSTASFGGATTFYIADAGSDRLASSANIAAGGMIPFNGSAAGFGVALDVGGPNALDIADGLALFAASNSNLYTLNVATGTASLVGPLSGAATLRGMAIVPAVFPVTLPVTLKVTSAKRIVTTKPTAKFKGTATCLAGIKLVQFKIGSGAFKNAQGTDSWNFTARKLKPGLNKIFVQATGQNDVQSSIAIVKVKVKKKK